MINAITHLYFFKFVPTNQDLIKVFEDKESEIQFLKLWGPDQYNLQSNVQVSFQNSISTIFQST